MNQEIDFYIPSCMEFTEGYKIYNQKECRGPVYFQAVSIISDNWGNAKKMAEGVSRLIRSWNRFFANFNFNKFVYCIKKNLKIIESFRKRNIESLSMRDNEIIRDLFNQFLDALQRESDKARSPVSVAKALNPLCPDFFPIWDSNIAYRYDCFYAVFSAMMYIKFCYMMKILANKIKHCVPSPDDRSLLKRIDEYNYSKYTMMWIL